MSVPREKWFVDEAARHFEIKAGMRLAFVYCPGFWGGEKVR
jgi:hypothetical protein